MQPGTIQSISATEGVDFCHIGSNEPHTEQEYVCGCQNCTMRDEIMEFRKERGLPHHDVYCITKMPRTTTRYTNTKGLWVYHRINHCPRCEMPYIMFSTRIVEIMGDEFTDISRIICQYLTNKYTVDFPMNALFIHKNPLSKMKKSHKNRKGIRMKDIPCHMCENCLVSIRSSTLDSYSICTTCGLSDIKVDVSWKASLTEEEEKQGTHIKDSKMYRVTRNRDIWLAKIDKKYIDIYKWYFVDARYVMDYITGLM
jgi:hypothetical protein